MKLLKYIAVVGTLGLVSCGKVEAPKNQSRADADQQPINLEAPKNPPTKEQNSDQRRLVLSAKSDEEIESLVQSHKHEDITELELRIEWAKCTAKGFSYLSEFKKLERLVLSGLDDTFTEKNGNYYFKPIATPDSFAEQISEIKSLKIIEVWYGCFPENQKKIIKSKLPDCKVEENLNKI